jgi:hypothetical protein
MWDAVTWTEAANYGSDSAMPPEAVAASQTAGATGTSIFRLTPSSKQYLPVSVATSKRDFNGAIP